MRRLCASMSMTVVSVMTIVMVMMTIVMTVMVVMMTIVVTVMVVMMTTVIPRPQQLDPYAHQGFLDAVKAIHLLPWLESMGEACTLCGFIVDASMPGAQPHPQERLRCKLLPMPAPTDHGPCGVAAPCTAAPPPLRHRM